MKQSKKLSVVTLFGVVAFVATTANAFDMGDMRGPMKGDNWGGMPDGPSSMNMDGPSSWVVDGVVLGAGAVAQVVGGTLGEAEIAVVTGGECPGVETVVVTGEEFPGAAIVAVTGEGCPGAAIAVVTGEECLLGVETHHRWGDGAVHKVGVVDQQSDTLLKILSRCHL